MITLFKLKEYAEYHGYYDGFYMQKVKFGRNINTNEEWESIGLLTFDIRLVKKGLASIEFEENLYATLKSTCENEKVINELEAIAMKGW